MTKQETPKEREHRIITKAERSGEPNLAFKLRSGADSFTIASTALESIPSKSDKYRFRYKTMGDEFLEYLPGNTINRETIRDWVKTVVQEIKDGTREEPYPFVHVENRTRPENTPLQARTIMKHVIDELISRHNRGELPNSVAFELGN